MKAAILLAVALLPSSALAQTKVERLVSQMSLAEKVGQLQSGAPAIPRLNIPAYDWWSEGLHGLARNGVATVFPQAIGLAATFDTALLRAVGETVSTEARAKFNAAGGPRADHPRYGGLTIWSPNINIFRDPRWGRGQETYGEDPYLTGALASAFVEGVQGDDPAHPRAVATVKHLAVHSGPEALRHGFDVDVSPQDLEATYTPAFRKAVTDGGVLSVMCAYNALHGVPVCASADLIQRRLRDAWGFKGFVVSDCDAVDDMTHFHFYRPDDAGSSAAAISAGTDLDCGTAYAGLTLAVQRGEVAEGVLDRALVRVLDARAALGLLGGPDRYVGIGPDQVDSPAHRALAREAARRSMVLLKNDGALPLKPGLRVAVIGPNADALESLEANYHGVAADPVTPLQGLRAALGPARILYAQGAPVAEGVPVDLPETALRASDAADAPTGLTGAYHAAASLDGAPALTRTDRTLAFDLDRHAPAPGLDPKAYAVRWSGVFIPPAPGAYRLGLKVERCFDCSGHDPARLYLDGKLVYADDGKAHAPVPFAELNVADTRPHALSIDYVHSGEDEGVRLQWIAPPAAQQAEALAAAQRADAVVAVVGLSPDVEGEELQVKADGFEAGDRTAIELPAVQRRLIEALEATGKPVVVVLMSGGAVADYGEDRASAALAAWYPGQAGGLALADVLTGRADAGGRLPVTFYASTRDLPAFGDYRMVGRTYRYLDKPVLHPFGYGLSYTRFAYSDAALSAPSVQAGQGVSVQARLTNTGARTGEEVAQLYLTPPAGDGHPLRSLVGFQRLTLKPGEARTVRFDIDPRDLSSVDPQGRRAVLPGRYGLFVGGGQPGTGAQGVELGLTIAGQPRELAP